VDMNREGIWIVRKIKGGEHKRFMSEKVEDLQNIILRSGIEPYRKDITKALKVYLDDHRIENGVNWFNNIKVRELVDLIFEQIKEK